MKKKISSSLLMASMLAVGSTGMLVSCSEDYDDDIKNLQSQIDGLATADDLNNRINEMASAIEQAKNEAIAKANAANEVALAAQQAAANAQNTAEGAQQVADAAMAKAEELEKNGATKEEVEAAREAAAAAQAFAEQAKQDADKALADLQAALDQAVAAATEAVSQAQATADNAQKTADEAKEAAQKAFDDAKALIDETAENAAEEAAKNAAAAAEALDAALKAEQVAQQGVADAASALAAAQAADGKAEEAKAAAALAQEAATKAQQTADEAKTLANQALGEISELESKLNQVIADGATKDELTSQINAAKDELKGLITAAENRATAVANTAKAAADAAQATANEALSIAQAAQSAIETINSKLNNETTGLAALNARLSVVEAWMKGAEAEGAQVNLKEVEAKLDSIDNDLKAIIGEYSTMVTSISLYATEGSYVNGRREFTRVTQKDNTFPKEDVTDAKLTFTEGNTLTDSVTVIVRVSPTNAVLKAGNVTLINSQGKELDVVKCTNVKPYNELLTTRGTTGNGLWELTFKMNENLSAEDFRAAVEHDGEYVLFAVAVKNTELSDADRRVITGYNITLTADEATAADNTFALKDNAGIWKSVENINNRYGKAGAQKEYVWKDAAKPATAPITSGQDINVKEGDNRSGQLMLAAEVGKAIEIKVDYDFYNEEVDHKIAGFYVTLDSKFADPNDPSELNSWNNYSYVGVGTSKQKATLFKGNEGKITIQDLNDDNVAGDIIGFRLYAVNLDGTLLDPDGRAFYVAVGDVATQAAIPAADVMAVTATNSSSDYIEVPEGTFINCSSAGNWTYVSGTKVNDVARTFQVNYYDKDKNQITSPADFSKIKYVKFILRNAQYFEDGGTYTQKLELYNRIGGTYVLAKTITATMTKTMPTDVKGDFGIKVGQEVAANTVRPFMVPNVTTGWSVVNPYATEGKADLKDIFNGLDVKGNNYRFHFSDDEIKDVTSQDGYMLEVAKKFITDKDYAVSVYSIYEGISAKLVDDSWVLDDYEVAYSKPLNMRFSTWSFGMKTKWEKTAPELEWTAAGNVATVDLSTIKVTNDRDSETFGGTLASLMSNSGKNYLNYVAGSAKLTAEDSSVNPYFTVSLDESTLKLTFTQKSTNSSQAPYDEHDETLSFKVVDAYGIEKTIELPVTVKNPNN